MTDKPITTDAVRAALDFHKETGLLGPLLPMAPDLAAAYLALAEVLDACQKSRMMLAGDKINLRAELNAETARAEKLAEKLERAEAAAELFGGPDWAAKMDYDSGPFAALEDKTDD